MTDTDEEKTETTDDGWGRVSTTLMNAVHVEEDE